jgi:RNA polymerase sigma-70 factor (ECF subfamily)
MFSDSFLDRVRQGDRAAREVLLSALRPLLRGVLCRRGCPESTASDLANEALLRIDTRFGSFRGGRDQLLAWCRMIAVHLWIDHCRRPPGPAPIRHDIIDARGPSPDDGLVREESRKTLLAALAQLHPRLRQILELRFLGGLSCAEVGERLGQGEEWVKVNSLRAFRKLRELLGEQP